MKELVKYLYKDTFLNPFLHPLKLGYDFFRFRFPLSDQRYVERQYYKSTGYPLNLSEPKTLSEKIQWLKLYDRKPFHTICADKFKVRDYIKQEIGKQYLIPLVFETKNVKAICKENMPDYPVIIKTNHDSGTYFIIKNKEDADYKKIRRMLKNKLRSNFYWYGREWQYKNIEPRIVVEKLLLDQTGNIPNDIKVHCFNGKARLFQEVSNRLYSHIARNFYNKEWQLMGFVRGPKVNGVISYKNGKPTTKPECLNTLAYLSEKIARKFVYVRVDFYVLDGQIFFGEITLTPDNGCAVTKPEEWDKKLGDWLELPVNMVKSAN